MFRPPYLDEEVSTLIHTLNRGMWQGHEVARIERNIRDRMAFVEAGTTSSTALYWTAKLQRELDPLLRLRFDFKNGWTLERWAQGCWNVSGVLGFQSIRIDLVDYLKAHDMQRWPSPEAYLEWKRANAAKVRADNDARATKKVQLAVDSLSSKQIKNFVDVERAIQTGDTVTMHGDDKKRFDRLIEGGKKALPGPRSSNPGMHPLRHRRKYRGGAYGS